MMGRTHALSGWCGGLALAPLLGQHTLGETLLVATMTAGYALFPDLDHRRSTASRLLGPITGGLSWLIRTSSSAIYQFTKGPRDAERGEHRTVWHTALAAAALGLTSGFASAIGGPTIALVILLFGVLLAIAALGDWVLIPLGIVGFAAFTTGSGAVLDEATGWIGYAVTVGCLIHDLGDSLTTSGCPWAWPIPIAGETFYELGPPAALRFRTGGVVENALVLPLFAAVGVVLIPGVLPVASDIVAAL